MIYCTIYVQVSADLSKMIQIRKMEIQSLFMKTIHVVAAIIRKDGKILATQRGYGEYKDGWEFPGGKINEGETP